MRKNKQYFRRFDRSSGELYEAAFASEKSIPKVNGLLTFFGAVFVPLRSRPPDEIQPFDEARQGNEHGTNLNLCMCCGKIDEALRRTGFCTHNA